MPDDAATAPTTGWMFDFDALPSVTVTVRYPRWGVGAGWDWLWPWFVVGGSVAVRRGFVDIDLNLGIIGFYFSAERWPNA